MSTVVAVVEDVAMIVVHLTQLAWHGSVAGVRRLRGAR